jgi:sarcosine oxidase subunit beta
VAVTSTVASFDVVVVGAGVIGLSTACHLAERGLSVTVVDRAGIGAGASGVQPGGVRQQWATRVNCLLARESLAFYREIGERLGTRLAPRFSACGYAFVAHSQERLDELAANVSLQQSLGIPSLILTPQETAEAVPELDCSSIRGAAWCAEDGYFDRAQEPVEAFAQAAEARGVVLGTAEVTRLVRDGGGWRAETAGGEGLCADQVVVAAASDSRVILRTLGVELPIEPERRYLFFSEPIRERLLDPLVVAGEIGFAAKQLADGRVLASDLRAQGDPEREVQSWRRTVRSGTESLLPRLQLVSFPHLVAGVYDVTPDHNPLVGPVPGAGGVWIAAGFSGHGFMLAPALGRLLAEAVASGHAEPLPGAFEVERFARSPVAAETQIV